MKKLTHVLPEVFLVLALVLAAFHVDAAPLTEINCVYIQEVDECYIGKQADADVTGYENLLGGGWFPIVEEAALKVDEVLVVWKMSDFFTLRYFEVKNDFFPYLSTGNFDVYQRWESTAVVEANVAEPSSIALLLFGLGALYFVRRQTIVSH